MQLSSRNINIRSILILLLLVGSSTLTDNLIQKGSAADFAPDHGSESMAMNGYNANLNYTFDILSQGSDFIYIFNYTYDLINSPYDFINNTMESNDSYFLYSYIIGIVDNSVFISFQSINNTDFDVNAPILIQNFNITASKELKIVKYGFHLRTYNINVPGCGELNFEKIINSENLDYLDYFDVLIPDRNNFHLSINLQFDNYKYIMNMAGCTINSSSEVNGYFINGNYTQLKIENVPKQSQIIPNLFEMFFTHSFSKVNEKNNPTNISLSTLAFGGNVSDFLTHNSGDFFYNTSGDIRYTMNNVSSYPEETMSIGLKFHLQYQSIFTDLNIRVGDSSYYNYLSHSGVIGNGLFSNLPGFRFGYIAIISFVSLAFIIMKLKKSKK